MLGAASGGLDGRGAVGCGAGTPGGVPHIPGESEAGIWRGGRRG